MFVPGPWADKPAKPVNAMAEAACGADELAAAKRQAADMVGSNQEKPAHRRPRLEALRPFAQRKIDAMKQRSSKVGFVSPLTHSEETLDREVLLPAMTSSHIDPTVSFLDHKSVYDASPLLALLRRMPKGGVLHTHGIASGCFEKLVSMLQKNDHIFVWQGDQAQLQGRLEVFPSHSHPGHGWVQASQCPQETLYSYLTLPKGLKSVQDCWREFGLIWERIGNVGSCAPFYFGREGFLWTILESQRAANVLYLEIKEPLYTPWQWYDRKELSDEEWVGQFCSTVKEFCAEHSDFHGARIVLTTVKVVSDEDARKHFRRALALKELFPDFIAGFDMAGPEDNLRPIEQYAQMLEEERAEALKRGIDLPLLLHAGETHVPEATQIVDAVLIGCERIGHGFALARHPTLIQEVLEAGISLECCPISNQVLGYFPDLAAHSVLGLLRAGVPVHLSPDDPAMWHYSDVSYDFAAATKAWHLNLLELKALARNSLAFSTLRGARQEAALAAWEAQWSSWVRAELCTAGMSAKP